VLDNCCLRNRLLDTEKLLWYVIHTKPGDEHRAETHLINQGIESFLPLIETTIRGDGIFGEKVPSSRQPGRKKLG